MNSIEGVVYCEHEGMIHDDDPDPLQCGPVVSLVFQEDSKHWELRSDPQYAGELWFFTCPGPHFKVYTRAEV